MREVWFIKLKIIFSSSSYKHLHYVPNLLPLPPPPALKALALLTKVPDRKDRNAEDGSDSKG